MKKILIISLVLTFLASCSFAKKETDFSTLYKNSVTAQMNRLNEFSDAVGYKRHDSIVGALKAGLQVPVLMSGALLTEYDIKINNTDMSAMLENMKLSFESPINTGLVSAKRIGITSITGDLYLLMEDFIDEGLFPAEARAIFAKYNNKWLSYTQKDMDAALVGASAEDVMISTIAKNISTMGIKEIEGYFTEYPIWKSTADLGMNGDLHSFAVDLDRDTVIGLVKKVTLDITGSGMTAEAEKALKTNLDTFTFSGVLSFNPSDAKVMEMKLVISQSGTLIGNIVFSTSASRTELQLSSVQDATNVILTITGDDKRSDMKLSLTQNDTPVGQLVGYIVRDGDSIRELSLDATAQGVSVTLKHTAKVDGSFEGSMNLPVGSLSWTGNMLAKKLTALSLKGVSPMGTIDMTLAPDGDKLRGPLVIKSGSDEIFRANIVLRIEEGIFALDLAVINPEGGDPSLTTNIEITHSMKKYTDTIPVPSPSEPLQNMITELEKLTPPEDAFIEDTSLDNVEPIESETKVLSGTSAQ